MSRSVMLIGFGAMARTVFEHLPEDVRLSCLLVRPGHVADAGQSVGRDVRVISALSECADDVDFALECAGHSAVGQYGPPLLEKGIHFGVVSIGALADAGLMARLEASARQGDAQVHVLAGAVAGIDALAAARADGLDEVIYCARKPPSSWRGSAAECVVDLDRLEAAETFFDGSARDAALAYPENANVAATIALAGLGFDRTRVKLVADPDAAGNLHRIHARGVFGEFSVELRGRPLPDNPKTSTLAALSALRALRNRSGWLVI